MMSLAPAGFTSSPASPLDIKPPTHALQLPDMSSAGETIFSAPSSDADVDSHTDDSSPEPDHADHLTTNLRTVNSAPATKNGRAFDLFSSSQPVTPATDHVLATSPIYTRTGPFEPPTVPDVAEARHSSISESGTPTEAPIKLSLTRIHDAPDTAQ